MRSLKQNILAGLLFGLSFVAATAVAAEEKMKIVASFSILGDMVEQVIGEHASVTTIVGPDADAHIYCNHPSQMLVLLQMQMLFL